MPVPFEFTQASGAPSEVRASTTNPAPGAVHCPQPVVVGGLSTPSLDVEAGDDHGVIGGKVSSAARCCPRAAFNSLNSMSTTK
jgi:hypothetical protein